MKTRCVVGVAILLALARWAPAQELRIQALDSAGRLTFAQISSATVYRVDCSTNLSTGVWSNQPPGLADFPAQGVGSRVVTVGMVLVSASFRVVASVTNAGGTAPAGMVLIPAGSFVMGSSTNVGFEGPAEEIPQHTVAVSGFYMDRYEVTKALWDQVASWAATNGYDIDTGSASGKATNHPALAVSWYEGVKWCNARSQQAGLQVCYTTNGSIYKTGNNSNVVCDWTRTGYRLPTEAEWEKAARGGVADTRFPWTDYTNRISHAKAIYNATNIFPYDVSPTLGWHPAYTNGAIPYSSPVGSFQANGYGLYDMAGNAFEWCWDWYAADYYTNSPASDPRGPDSGRYRVGRGGDWNLTAYYARCAARYGFFLPASGLLDNGFRTVRRQ